MRQISHKQAQKNRELAKIKKELSPFCFICGRPAVDLMHIFPRSSHSEYYTERWNIVPGCRECHNKFDNDLQFRQKQTKLFNRVKQHDPQAAARYFKIFK